MIIFLFKYINVSCKNKYEEKVKQKINAYEPSHIRFKII